MKFKTDREGIYVRKMNSNEFNYTPTKLDRISRIAFGGKKEENTYQIIFFTENEPEFTKFGEDVKYLASTKNITGELLAIVDDRIGGLNQFFNREVIFEGDSFEVRDDEFPYKGRLYFPNSYDNVIYVTFTNIKTGKQESNKFRFISILK